MTQPPEALLVVRSAVTSCIWKPAGCHSLRTTEPASVLGFLESLRAGGRKQRSGWGTNFRHFLKITQRAGLLNALKWLMPSATTEYFPFLTTTKKKPFPGPQRRESFCERRSKLLARVGRGPARMWFVCIAVEWHSLGIRSCQIDGRPACQPRRNSERRTLMAWFPPQLDRGCQHRAGPPRLRGHRVKRRSPGGPFRNDDPVQRSGSTNGSTPQCRTYKRLRATVENPKWYSYWIGLQAAWASPLLPCLVISASMIAGLPSMPEPFAG